MRKPLNCDLWKTGEPTEGIVEKELKNLLACGVFSNGNL